MMKFTLQAVLIPATLIAGLLFGIRLIPCSGLDCAGNSILFILGFGALLIGVTIAGFRYAPTHRVVYAVVFPVCTIVLLLIAIKLSPLFVASTYQMNNVNETESKKHGFSSLSLYSERADISIPKTLGDSYWSAVQTACSRAGYTIESYAGDTLTILRYSMSPYQKWGSLRVGVVVLNDLQDVACMFKEVRQNEDGAPQILPSPNVFAIDETNGFFISAPLEVQYK